MTAGNRPAGPPARHPDLDTLADLDAGLLDAPAAERLTAHVAGCADCTRAVAALGAVRADLAALPAPPLPDAVAARLDATLAGLRRDDDRLARAGSAAAGGVPDTSPHSPGSGSARPAAERGSGDAADLDAARQRRRQRSLRRAGGAVAAAFALLAAGASVTALVRTVDTGADSAGGGGVALESGSDAPAPAGEDPAAGGAAGAATAPRDASIPSYTRETLRRDLATIERDATLGAGAGRASSGPAGAMADPDRRRACERSIIGREGVLRAVLRIRYDGQPAYAFVFDDGPARRAYVVGDQCGTGGLSPVLDRVS